MAHRLAAGTLPSIWTKRLGPQTFGSDQVSSRARHSAGTRALISWVISAVILFVAGPLWKTVLPAGTFGSVLLLFAPQWGSVTPPTVGHPAVSRPALMPSGTSVVPLRSGNEPAAH